MLSGKEKGDLQDLSSKFYTYIPHNFSMKHMSLFTIDTHDKLKEKLDLIQNLTDIKIAHKLMNPKIPKKLTKSPLDDKYESLNCKLDILDKASDEYLMVENYLS